MNRREFLAIAGGSVVIAGVPFYLGSEKSNFIRADIHPNPTNKNRLQKDEMEILYLASLAPSGHNTQPWMVKYIEPYRYIICNDKTRWLPAVDPAQRETILSLGAFIQNLEYAANSLGYSCRFSLLASTNQEENIMEVSLAKQKDVPVFDATKIIQRRTVRSHFLEDEIIEKDLTDLLLDDKENFYFFSRTVKEYRWLNEQTIEANRIQSNREDANRELAEWIRFSNKDASKYCDGITTGSMEIDGVPGWILRNFYSKKDVLKKSFQKSGVDMVAKQVAASGGWVLITSKDNTTDTLIETGRRLQRFLLKVRDKNIAVHPMTQVLEEKVTSQLLPTTLGIKDRVQFILRTGYLTKYPEPVSLRRPVNEFVYV